MQGIYYVAGTVLNILQIVSPVITTATLGGQVLQSHFTDGEVEVER